MVLKEFGIMQKRNDYRRLSRAKRTFAYLYTLCIICTRKYVEKSTGATDVVGLSVEALQFNEY